MRDFIAMNTSRFMNWSRPNYAFSEMSDSAMAKEISDVVAHVSDIVCGAADDSGSLSVPATTPATLTTKQSDDGDVTKKRADRIEAKHEVLDVYDFVVSDEEFGEDEYEDDVRETKEEEERRLAGVAQLLDGFPDDAELSGASDGEWTPSSINAVSTPDGSSVFAAVDDDGGVSDEMGVQGGAEQSRALLPALNRQLGIMRVKRTQNAQSSLVVKKRRLGKIVPGKTVRGPKIAHVVFGAAGQCEVGEAPVPARGEATGQSSGAEESDADATTATDTTTKVTFHSMINLTVDHIFHYSVLDAV